MKSSSHNSTPSPQAIEARAALEALFSDPNAPQPEKPPAEGAALVQKKNAEANTLSKRIDLLRRKREALDELERAAAARGYTLAELAQVDEPDE